MGGGAVGEDHLLAGAVHTADPNAKPDVHAVGGEGFSIGQGEGIGSGASYAEVGHQYTVVRGLGLFAHHGQADVPVADRWQQFIDQACSHGTKTNNDNLLTHEASDV
ncbi:hypothetical protein AHiyo4_14740 [Arthrobacter sp. Hiyo4]|nr:hypothetical protein AHiyo4_14740 [Arthrobacter sp. Hiyo4]